MCGELVLSICEGLHRRADSFQTENKTVEYAAFGVGGMATPQLAERPSHPRMICLLLRCWDVNLMNG